MCTCYKGRCREAIIRPAARRDAVLRRTPPDSTSNGNHTTTIGRHTRTQHAIIPPFHDVEDTIRDEMIYLRALKSQRRASLI